MKGQWTKHTLDCQGEVLTLLREAGGQATMRQLYHRGAWGIRTQTLNALIRKGKITCDGQDVWHGTLKLIQ